jgi:hypothetical protein
MQRILDQRLGAHGDFGVPVDGLDHADLTATPVESVYERPEVGPPLVLTKTPCAALIMRTVIRSTTTSVRMTGTSLTS